LALTPKITLILLAVFLILFSLTSYVSLGSLVAAIIYPILTVYLQKDPAIIIFAVLVALLIVVRHKANIQRLLSGTENKIKFGKSKS